MKYWKIETLKLKHKYLILTEKSVWLTDQDSRVDINELIESKKLGVIKSIRYKDLKKIVFVDTDCTIEFVFKEGHTPDQTLEIDAAVYGGIKEYLKNKLKGTELKEYTVFKQMVPYLIAIGVLGLYIVITYFAAVELEAGGSMNLYGRKAWLKHVIVSISGVLGTSGTIIVGTVIISLLAYFMIHAYKNPKIGEVLKITKYPQLSV
ncbi:MAG: hypothetical protein COB98_04670 [Flavobacteriaceae bacterium]|nr:MAG: hypothetical protein COB98_04670 [Flavobacteriaceae bacterium]